MLELVRGGESSGGAVRAFFNLGDRPVPLPGGVPAGTAILFSSEAAAYGGDRREAGAARRAGPVRVHRLRPSFLEGLPVMSDGSLVTVDRPHADRGPDSIILRPPIEAACIA